MNEDVFFSFIENLSRFETKGISVMLASILTPRKYPIAAHSRNERCSPIRILAFSSFLSLTASEL